MAVDSQLGWEPGMGRAPFLKPVAIGDNLGNKLLTEEDFRESHCPLCGGDLKFGSGAARMENTNELSMVTDIDSGEKISGEFEAAMCPQCEYQKVRAEIEVYAGY